jgi:hypothetical protein
MYLVARIAVVVEEGVVVGHRVQTQLDVVRGHATPRVGVLARQVPHGLVLLRDLTLNLDPRLAWGRPSGRTP